MDMKNIAVVMQEMAIKSKVVLARPALGNNTVSPCEIVNPLRPMLPEQRIRQKQNNMSVAHSGVSFNHSCLKVPIDPRSRRPSPTYERVYKSKLSNVDRKSDCRETSAVSSTTSSVENNYKSVESYLKFYEAIPDYSELHHLSDDEFYSRLNSLKITQKRFCNANHDEKIFEPVDRPSSHSSLGFQNKYNPEDIYGKEDLKKKGMSRVSSAYSNSSSGQGKVTLKTSAIGCGKRLKNCWTKPVISDSENISDFGLDDKTPSGVCLCKEGVCKGCQENSVAEFWKKDGYTDDGWVSDDGFKSKSMPSSPGWKTMCRYAPDVCDCFLDRPLRNSEYGLRAFHHHVHCGSSGLKKNDSPKKQKKFNTRPVPLLSRIPLYEKIMAEQEKRRRINHNRYSRELRALVQPFSFTKREEEEKQRMRMTRSNPELNLSPKRSQITFKAKPVPKNLFSDYAYERMREEDFYRALKKRIRAEELMKSSSLPPSMAAREKYRSKSLDFLDGKYSKEARRGHKRTCDDLRREIELDEKIRSGKNQKRRGKPFWLNRKSSNSITDSSAEASPYESVSEPERRQQKRPLSAISINRSNLASVLRMQTVRKRMEKEMEDNLEESRAKQHAKFKERLIRMTPAWRALNYSTEEDLALRVAARREEERMKKKRYEKLMGSIYGRVHQMPPLFQRQSSNMKQVRTRDEKETPLKHCSYYDQDEREGKEKDSAEKSFKSSDTYKNHFSRSCKSSESSVTHEKSEGSKIDESDNETGSREDEIEEYTNQPGDTVQNGSR